MPGPLQTVGQDVSIQESPLQDQLDGEWQDVGIPFPSRHYAPSDYGGSPQNWAIAQDDRGLIYVANNDGVLQFDGERWRLIQSVSNRITRSLAADSLVYVGRKGDFGVLRPDSIGVLRYHSLTSHIPEGARDFDDVWHTYQVDDGAYFQATEYLYRWDGSDVRVWESEEGFHTSFTVAGNVYVRERGRGLLKMESDSLVLVPEGRAFSTVSIRMMASHPSGDILIATEEQGLYLLGGEGLRRLRSGLGREGRAYFRRHGLYHGCKLPGNRYALATLGGGTAIINAHGEIVRIFDQSSGLSDEVVNYVFAGREGELWMALNNDGIYRTSISPSTTLFDRRSGLSGTIEDLHRHEGEMYAATGSGLHLLRSDSESTRQRPHFVKQSDLPLAWDLLSVNDALLAATEKGVYQLDEGVQQITERQAYILAKSDDGRTIYAGRQTGLVVLERRDESWSSFALDGFEGEVRSVAVGRKNRVWVGTVDGDILRITLSETGHRISNVIRFNEASGLPAGYKSPVMIGEEIAIRSREGLFRLQSTDGPASEWQFESPPSLLPGNGMDTLAVKAFLKGPSGRYWTALGDRVFLGNGRPEEDVRWTEVDALRFPKEAGVHLYASMDSTLWLGTGQKLVRHIPSPERYRSQSSSDFFSLIRQVTTLPKKRVVYGGAPRGNDDNVSLTLPYSANDFRVEVAAPLYDTVTPSDYQYRLRGHRSGWTSWTSRSHITFSNLWEGTYQFRVRARESGGRLSQVGTMTLHIEPPWYRSLWAYLLYGVGAICLLLGFRRYYQMSRERRQAQRQVARLEKEKEAKEKLKRANDRLREANQLKEDFLANTSHELRTPLTNILGFVDVLRDTASVDQKRFLSAIEKNSRRLERTLNALLELSRLQSGSEVLDVGVTAVGERIHRMAPELREAAESKGLSFWVDVPEGDVYAKADERYLDQILANLIENAIKFTEEGHVAVSATETEELVEVRVKDTGIGIDEEFLPRLFQDFEQESRGRSRSYEGYGLGLAISTRLAKRMDGRIEVESTKGEGSTFVLFLPPCADSVSNPSSPAA